jgi:hypothetical protein
MHTVHSNGSDANYSAEQAVTAAVVAAIQSQRKIAYMYLFNTASAYSNSA